MFGTIARLFTKPSQSPPKPSVLDDYSIYLGHYHKREEGTVGIPLEYDGERHLLLFGPNGTGKGTRILVPNLLKIKNKSLIVIDPKGELTAITADYRRTLGDVIILNPFNVLGLGGSGFNPLSSLNPDSVTFVDDAAALGEALIKIEGHEPHWPESAQELIVALLMWEVILAQREKRSPSLLNVRRYLTEAEENKPDGRGRSVPFKGLKRTAIRMIAEGGFEIESLMGRFMSSTDETSSIKSTADTQTRWLLSRPMRTSLERNDIDFTNLKKRPITVYLILPAERMRTHSVWLRLVIVSALRALYSPGGIPTIFMLDEFAQLGHLGPIEDAFGLVRGYGVQLWPILQDLNQLKALYKDRWETFVGNAGVVQAFAPNDLTTAGWMSKRAGDTTVVAASYSTGDGQSIGNSENNNVNINNNSGLTYSQVKRPLFLPQELMDFKAGAGLIWTASSSKSIPFFGHPYWQLNEIAGRAGPNPYYVK